MDIWIVFASVNNAIKTKIFTHGSATAALHIAKDFVRRGGDILSVYRATLADDGEVTLLERIK